MLIGHPLNQFIAITVEKKINDKKLEEDRVKALFFKEIFKRTGLHLMPTTREEQVTDMDDYNDKVGL